MLQINKFIANWIEIMEDSWNYRNMVKMDGKGKDGINNLNKIENKISLINYRFINVIYSEYNR